MHLRWYAWDAVGWINAAHMWLNAHSYWIAACAVVAVVSIAGNIWFSPSGTGEYRKSPDGRFTANAMNLSRGTCFNGRVHYIELSVVEAATESDVWRVRFYHDPSVQAQDYGSRSQTTFIHWDPNSSQVTIPVVADRHVTLPMP